MERKIKREWGKLPKSEPLVLPPPADTTSEAQRVLMSKKGYISRRSKDLAVDELRLGLKRKAQGRKIKRKPLPHPKRGPMPLDEEGPKKPKSLHEIPGESGRREYWEGIAKRQMDKKQKIRKIKRKPHPEE